MKKLFSILFLAGALVACNSGEDEETMDTTTTTVDTMTTPMPMDTTGMGGDTTRTDTTGR